MAGRKKTVDKYLNVKHLRGRFGLNQSEIAEVIGCSASNYAGKENGRYAWSLRECVVLQEFFNKKLEKLGEEKITLDDLFLPTKCQM